MKTVQIVLRNQKYALELCRLLSLDGKHNVLIMSRPDPIIAGVIVIDERFRQEILSFDKATLARTIIFFRKDGWTHLRDAGAQNVIQVACPPYLGLQVVLGLETQLALRAADAEMFEDLKELRNELANAIVASPEIAEALDAFRRRGREVQIEFEAVVISREPARDIHSEEVASRPSMFDEADKSFLQALRISAT